MDHFELSVGAAALTEHAETWDLLAAERPNPFFSSAWLSQWAKGHPAEQTRCATLCSPSGELLAGALFRTAPLGLASAASPSTDWDMVAVDEASRRRLWQHVARLGLSRLHLSGVYAGTRETDIACQALAEAGYGVLPSVREAPSPYVTLPHSFEELVARQKSRSLKRQLKKRRDLDARGAVRLRTSSPGAELEHNFDEFLRVEAAGWKGREGTAIASKPQTEAEYRGFARAAAELGWLRLTLLALEDKVIAAHWTSAWAVSCSRSRPASTRRMPTSPGHALNMDVFEAAIAEGLRGVDLMGRAEDYKMAWADRVNPGSGCGSCAGRSVARRSGAGTRICTPAWSSCGIVPVRIPSWVGAWNASRTWSSWNASRIWSSARAECRPVHPAVRSPASAVRGRPSLGLFGPGGPLRVGLVDRSLAKGLLLGRTAFHVGIPVAPRVGGLAAAARAAAAGSAARPARSSRTMPHRRRERESSAARSSPPDRTGLGSAGSRRR